MRKLSLVLVLGLCIWGFARDTDGDGIPDKVDECPTKAEDYDQFNDRDGCPDPDNDLDKVCDPWVVAKGEEHNFTSECKGTDACPLDPEDHDGFEDSDGCPDPDNDKDGIPDIKDKCPNEPEDFDGFEDSDGCPDPDNDKDGISDLQDKCPNAPEDFDGFEDTDGCPDPDNDKDGIPDNKDECPNEPENFNDFKDEDGCPDIAITPLSQGQTFPDIGFRTGTAEITFESHRYLDSIAIKLGAYPNQAVKFLLFAKFANRKNAVLELLAERQQALVGYMVSKGIASERIILIDYSENGYTEVQGSTNDFNQNGPLTLAILPFTPSEQHKESSEPPLPEISE